MEDLIPFLIVIAISIIGAAFRKKKKNPFFDSISETETEPEPRQDDFLSWMERFVDEKPEPIPYEKVEPLYNEPVSNEKSTTYNYEDPGSRSEQYNNYTGFISPEEKEQMMAKEAPRMFVKETHQPIVTESAKSVVKEVTDDLTTQSIKDGEIGRERVDIDFDLKKAVIFSTILSRKYI